MRYYYKDPLAAAWMAKHFGMIFPFLNENRKKGNYKTSTLAMHNTWKETFFQKTPERYYIHLDSVHLLEINIGDVLWTGQGTGIKYIDPIVEPDYNLKRVKNELKDSKYNIIERNGIHFMWPEIEGCSCGYGEDCSE